MTEYTAYTDGAYSPLRDQGGIGIVIIKDNKVVLQYNKMYKNTTNCRMELQAVITALRCIKNKIDKLNIISDSQYVIGCIGKGWERKKNQDLWNEFEKVENDTLKLCKDISYLWIKGHSDNEWNNLADSLAVKASKEVQL